MLRLKRFIDCIVPINKCNLRCPYCYITQNKLWDSECQPATYGSDIVEKALSYQRLGGITLFNICGNGETLLDSNLPSIIKAILRQGHYINIVTNGTISSAFSEIFKLPHDFLERIMFKFSFHYLELERLNLMGTFFENVKNARKHGCSVSVELVSDDRYIDCIEDIKRICLSEIGALCHITVARVDNVKGKPVYSNFSNEDLYKIWGQFNSPLYEFKRSIWGEKRNEFCYAGDWSTVLNLNTGDLSCCYCGPFIQNIFRNPEIPIRFRAIGKHCREGHCYNGHAFLTLGVIPELHTPDYCSMRNRICADNTEWIGPKMKNIMSRKLYESNSEYNATRKIYIDLSHKLSALRHRIKKMFT
jgi:hypothetical protein